MDAALLLLEVMWHPFLDVTSYILCLKEVYTHYGDRSTDEDERNRLKSAKNV